MLYVESSQAVSKSHFRDEQLRANLKFEPFRVEPSRADIISRMLRAEPSRATKFEAVPTVGKQFIKITQRQYVLLKIQLSICGDYERSQKLIK